MGNQLIEICANVKTKRCPEYDTFEGNSETMSVAIHTCDYTPPNEYPSCDRVSMLTRAKERKFFLYLFFLLNLILQAGCGTNACDGIGG